MAIRRKWSRDLKAKLASPARAFSLKKLERAGTATAVHPVVAASYHHPRRKRDMAIARAKAEAR